MLCFYRVNFIFTNQCGSRNFNCFFFNEFCCLFFRNIVFIAGSNLIFIPIIYQYNSIWYVLNLREFFDCYFFSLIIPQITIIFISTNFIMLIINCININHHVTFDCFFCNFNICFQFNKIITNKTMGRIENHRNQQKFFKSKAYNIFGELLLKLQDQVCRVWQMTFHPQCYLSITTPIYWLPVGITLYIKSQHFINNRVMEEFVMSHHHDLKCCTSNINPIRCNLNISKFAKVLDGHFNFTSRVNCCRIVITFYCFILLKINYINFLYVYFNSELSYNFTTLFTIDFKYESNTVAL